MNKSKHSQLMIWLIAAGFFVRFFLIPFPGHEHDMAWWKSWSLFAADKGPVQLVENGNFYNYPSFFSLFMTAVGIVYRLIGNPYNVNQFWSTTSIGFLILFKGLAIAADACIAYLIYRICQPRAGQKIASILSLLFFLNPVIIFDSAFWGQVDSLGFLFFIFSIYLLDRKKIELASFVFVLGFLFKLQNIVFIPLFYLFIFANFGWAKLCKSIFYSFLALVCGNLPFILTQKSNLILTSLEKNTDYYPYFSLKAYNFWSILMKSGDWGKYPDQMILFGSTSAKTLGMLLFVFSYGIACLYVFLNRQNKEGKSLGVFVGACSLAILSFFTVVTQMHDRYLFAFLPLVLILFATKEDIHAKIRQFAYVFLVFSILYAGNLYASFSFQYQYLGLKILQFTNERAYTLLVSTVVTATWAFAIWQQIKKLPRAFRFLPLGIPIILLASNLGYLRHKPISLTNYLASNWTQSWGRPMKNKAVNSFAGPYQWQRLSANYFFTEKGIGTHAFSEIYFYPNGFYSKFETDYSMDNGGQPDSKIIFQVEADGKILYTSSLVGKYDPPRHLSVNISGTKKLTLRVLDGGDGINGDHADWLNPVFYR